MEHQHDERQPSQVTDDAWIVTYRRHYDYPPTAQGKWLIYATRDKIDNLWKIITLATEEGYLGSFSKVSTAGLAYTASSGVHTICVYTHDCNDLDDIQRIRAMLRELGITQKISYKAWTRQELITLYNE